MLQLEQIRKAYTTASFTQVALDDVSVAFRDNEFAAILGPSGSGKTTLLNILGGLDHADSGDIVINGVSTKAYTDKDWDAYRNHRIGFIFQSYNLIPHQTILSNVELALTLAGISAADRRERALRELDRVGLAEHANKRPSQLSGGQMQRVAIARALVNDPDIVLADEPTGALDTETGIQVMELLKEIARDRLVVMVTHNPELAEQYATRIIRLRDGRIVDDTDPIAEEVAAPLPSYLPASVPGQAAGTSRASVSDATRHASMSFLTALALSFNNLMTKKGRTFMTAFAGSIGIIGIAAILSLSNGVNSYIADTEESALTSYPLTITKSSFDISNLMLAGAGMSGEDETQESDSADRTIDQYTIMTDMFAEVKNNDLMAFKEYVESGESGIEPYVNSIEYSYGITPQIYKAGTKKVVCLNPSKMSETLTNGIMGSALTGGSSMTSFTQFLDNEELVDEQVILVEGRMPEAYDECVLVLNSRGHLSDYTLYSLGFYDIEVMDDMVSDVLAGKEVDVPDEHAPFSIDDALDMHFKVVPAYSLYQKNEDQDTWTDMSSDRKFMRKALKKAVDLKVVGVVKRSDSASGSSLTEGIAYTPALTQHLMDMAADAPIVREQLADPDRDVFTGKTFEDLQSDEDNAFDLESMFEIDEDAMQKAFSFDASTLEGFGEGLDLSGLDLGGALSGMDLSGLDLSGIDLSNVKIDSSQMASAFDEQAMAQIMAGAPQFTMQPVDFSLSPEELGLNDLPDEEREEVNALVGALVADFPAWQAQWLADPANLAKIMSADGSTDYTAMMQEFLAAEAAAGKLSGMDQLQQGMEERIRAVMEERIRAALEASMTAYMTEFSTYFQNAMAAQMEQSAQAMGQQIAGAIGAELAGQVGSKLSNQMAAATGQIGQALASEISSQMSGQMSTLSSAMEDGFTFDGDAFSQAIKFNMTQEDLASLLTNYMNADELSYDANLMKLGYATADDPEEISIYPVDFAAKEAVLDIIDAYNADREAAGDDAGTIQYSDFAGVLMSSVTDIVNTISLVLIAFVSISLVVSSIMISIITYISVLERKKEIGILRAMGASKLNVANIFNAETVIEGLFAGILAVAVVYLVSVPVNAIILETHAVPNIMQLPVKSALGLVAVSVALTLVAGLIPSSAAARRDPVEALRSE